MESSSTICLEHHIAHLRTEPEHVSDSFVPMELGFQIQALSGEVRSENDGEFSIRVMINVGQIREDAARVYIGGESVVTLSKTMDFISTIHESISDFL